MPNLEEYRAKTLFGEAGINVPRGQAVSAFAEVRRDIAAGTGQLVLKSQLPVGSRAKKGGVVFAAASDMRDRLDALLKHSIDGMLPDKVLVEERVEYSEEYYMSIYSDPAARSPVVLFSSKGGTDVETAENNVVSEPLNILEDTTAERFAEVISRDRRVSPCQAAELAEVAVKAYGIYRKYDCRLVEINPLVRAKSALLALDAKIVIDEDAVFRHGELGLDFIEEIQGRQPTELERIAGKIDEHDHRGTAHFVQLVVRDIRREYGDSIRGLIGFNCVGTGMSLTVMDELAELGYFPRNFGDTSGNPPASKVYRMTKLILSQEDIEGYVFATCVSSQQLDNTARGVIKALKELYPATGGLPTIPFVMLFRGAWEDEAMGLFRENGMVTAGNLCMLDSRYTERDLAREFDRIYRRWKNGEGPED